MAAADVRGAVAKAIYAVTSNRFFVIHPTRLPSALIALAEQYTVALTNAVLSADDVAATTTTAAAVAGAPSWRRRRQRQRSDDDDDDDKDEDEDDPASSAHSVVFYNALTARRTWGPDPAIPLPAVTITTINKKVYDRVNQLIFLFREFRIGTALVLATGQYDTEIVYLIGLYSCLLAMPYGSAAELPVLNLSYTALLAGVGTLLDNPLLFRVAGADYILNRKLVSVLDSGGDEVVVSGNTGRRPRFINIATLKLCWADEPVVPPPPPPPPLIAPVVATRRWPELVAPVVATRRWPELVTRL